MFNQNRNVTWILEKLVKILKNFTIRSMILCVRKKVYWLLAAMKTIRSLNLNFCNVDFYSNKEDISTFDENRNSYCSFEMPCHKREISPSLSSIRLYLGWRARNLNRRSRETYCPLQMFYIPSATSSFDLTIFLSNLHHHNLSLRPLKQFSLSF